MTSNSYPSIIVLTVVRGMRVRHVIHVMTHTPPVNIELGVIRVMHAIRVVRLGHLSCEDRTPFLLS